MGGAFEPQRHLPKGETIKDTSPEVEGIYTHMIMEKTGEEKLKMGFSMFDFARWQVIASIKKDRPNIDDRDLRRELFLRFYGRDFPSEDLQKIIEEIRNY